MGRVRASEATRKRIEAMHSSNGEVVEKSELVPAVAHLIVEEALEEEVNDALGRDFYEHGAKSGSGYNGFRRWRVKSAEGTIRRCDRVRSAAGMRSRRAVSLEDPRTDQRPL